MDNEPIKDRSSIGVNEISGRWPRDKTLCRAENADERRIRAEESAQPDT